MSNNKPLEVPFRQDGSLMHFADSRRPVGGSAYYDAWEWRVPGTIQLRLTLEGSERGRSAAYFLWLDEDGRRWPMFLAEMVELIKSATLTDGFVAGMWTVRKRGANFGLRYAGSIAEVRDV